MGSGDANTVEAADTGDAAGANTVGAPPKVAQPDGAEAVATAGVVIGGLANVSQSPKAVAPDVTAGIGAGAGMNGVDAVRTEVADGADTGGARAAAAAHHRFSTYLVRRCSVNLTASATGGNRSRAGSHAAIHTCWPAKLPCAAS